MQKDEGVLECEESRKLQTILNIYQVPTKKSTNHRLYIKQNLEV